MNCLICLKLISDFHQAGLSQSTCSYFIPTLFEIDFGSDLKKSILKIVTTSL